MFDPRVAGSMVRHLASAISGPAVARGTTFLKDKLGAAGLCPGRDHRRRPAAAPWAALAGVRRRGHPGRAPPIWSTHGVLTTWLLDCASARQLGLSTTGHAVRDVSSAPAPAPTNAYIEPGAARPTELMSDIKEGLYVI